MSRWRICWLIRPGAVMTAARRIVVGSEEGGRCCHQFCHLLQLKEVESQIGVLAGDSGNGGRQLRQGSGGGSRPLAMGLPAWTAAESVGPLQSWRLNYVSLLFVFVLFSHFFINCS
jgi:hypothetical protein